MTNETSSQCYRILSALRKGSITTADMLNWRIGKYSSRISELRAEGHVIRAERIGKGLWRYELEKPLEVPQKAPEPVNERLFDYERQFDGRF